MILPVSATNSALPVPVESATGHCLLAMPTAALPAALTVKISVEPRFMTTDKLYPPMHASYWANWPDFVSVKATELIKVAK